MDDSKITAAAQLSQRGYIVRPAAQGDLDRLVQLEALCWQHTRTSPQQLKARLQRYPDGQFVLERNAEVLGVIYSQRIANADALADRSAANVHELHDASGSIVQLLALNVDPKVQNLSLGDQLLEFMLQRCGSLEGVERVVGVTVCKRFDAADGIPFDEYIQRQDGRQDPVLALHCSHGASVLGSIANYRPEDVANEGCGVLVSYNVHQRNTRPSTSQNSTIRSAGFERHDIEDFIRSEVVRAIGDEREFDAARPLMEMGLSSADLLQLQLQMERQFACRLGPGFFFEHSSVDKVAAYLAATPPVRDNVEASQPVGALPHSIPADSRLHDANRSKDIAIVGMSCRLPGGIETPDDLWRVLSAAECVIGTYPSARGDWPSAGDYPGIDQGGYIEDGDAFDATFFRVTPAEAQVTDPQQRILLELAWACLEDAGVLPAQLRGTRTGVFVGASNGDYSRLIQAAGVETEAHHATGSSLAVIANRLSYFFDLSGPSMLIDTACSSSLVALHTALGSMHAGECGMALVGGVNFICHPALSVAYHKAGMLAADGRCKVFDARANGYVRAEGAVMLLLKPLSEAIAHRDNIHAVIKGSAVNHGGLSGGLTVPDPKKQSELLAAAWGNAGVLPGELSYIEAHGTGTSLGDPIELQGIRTAYAKFHAGNTAQQPCAVGSIKSNLGHLESAAGITGLLKVVLAMKHRQLPGQPTFESLNPKIDLQDSPLCIAQHHCSWDVKQPRLAAVSSFGSGGANAHCVIAEHVTKNQEIFRATDLDYLFVMSAADQARLRACAAKALDWLEAMKPGRRFVDAVYTWQVGRTAMKRRLAIKAKDPADLRTKLQQWLNEPGNPIDTWSGEADSRNVSGSRSQAQMDKPLVEQALTQRNLEQLALAWISGADVDWHKLYATEEVPPQRITVPNYSFAKSRHWIQAPSIEAIGIRATEIKPDAFNADMPVRQSAAAQLLVTPVWEAAPVFCRDDSRSGDFGEHRILLCDTPELDAEEIRVLARAQHCSHLCSQWQPGQVGERYTGHALACFEEVRRIIADRPRARVLLQVAVAQQHGVMLLAGLSGLFSTAARENPHLIAQIILTDAAVGPDELAAQLRREKDLSSDTLIRYAQGTRQVLRWREVLPKEPTALAYRHGGVYLITGGLGGLGTLFAKDILRRAAQARVVLTGRSELAGKQKQSLDKLTQLAVEQGAFAPEYRQLDLTDLEQTRAVIDAVVKQHGRIDGIIHGAGMIRDSFILKKTAQDFERVLAPKVAGTLNLDEASKDLQLDFIALFSSFVSTVGNIGQADYAAANGFMDQFAAYRNQLVATGCRHGQTLSIQWSLWREGGMAMDPQSVEILRQETGMQPLQTATGLRAFHDAVLSGNAQVMLLEGEIEKLKQTVTRANRISVATTSSIAAAAFGSQQLREETLKRVAQLFGEAIKLPAAEVDTVAPLSGYGLDSILINLMNRKLADVCGEISKTLFFECATLAELADYLIQQHEAACIVWSGLEKTPSALQASSDVPQAIAPESQTWPPAGMHRQEPIAIIGISGIYPQAATIEEFWNNLEAGRNCVGEIPPQRWALDGFYVADMEQAVAQGKSYSKWGGFIEQFAEFEPLFFNISPREALNMDPQERLFLQEAWRALENAGYTRGDLKRRFGRKVGVFAGITKTGFELYATPAACVDDGFFPRTSFSSVANRVSYHLDIGGPSLPVDTMCSSSLTAIHQACEHINRGECELAFAGGVNLYLHPASYTWLCSQQMLSRDGLCRSFGAGGNGYVPGEGVGVVLLKSLSAALRDGDNIHGVILATHVNHGGKANGYTVPSPRAQADLIRRTMEKAGIGADDISYIEAHGTGTELGDPIEISGLQQAFATRAGANPCSIGSAKSNIGHLEAAAGIAALTKVLLQMKHQAIAPSLHARQLNPNIDFAKGVFRVNQNLSPWPDRGPDGNEAPRIAGISSFGAGGANAHIIVQEFRAPESRGHASDPDEPHAIVLSAGTRPQLEQRARDLLSFVQAAQRGVDLKSLAYTLQVGREAMDVRLGLLVNSLDQLTSKLQAYLSGEDAVDGIYQGYVKSDKATLRLFAGDEDFQSTLDRWLVRRKFSKLLQLWTQGLDVVWDKLYESTRPRRMALPTYPFAKERYWIDAVAGVRAWDAAATTATVHPLLHANTSDLNRQSYTSTFTGEEFFLREHQVRGRKVLPAVAYLEMARAAIDLASPNPRDGSLLELSNTAWLQPLVVSSPGKVVIALYCSDAEPAAIDFNIHSVGCGAGDAETTHCQGQARWVQRQGATGIDIEQLKAQMTQALDIAEFYERFARSGIDYGPAHRAITALHLGEGQLLARLNVPAGVEATRQSYLLHPSLLDSALQGCMALVADTVEQQRGTLLPFALDTLRVLAPCTSEMFAWVRCAHGAAESALKFDVDLCDRSGNVCVQMYGFCSRALDGQSESLLEKHAGNERLYSLVPIWSRAEHGHGPPGSVLMLGEQQASLDWLRQSCPHAEFLQLPENASIDTIGGLLEQRSFDHLLWIAPDVLAPQDSGIANIIADQERGVLAVFRIAKALVNSSRVEGSLQWTLITRNTQDVRRNDTVCPTHGGISGLAGSLAREYPQWNLQLVDVDDIAAVSAEQCLSLPWNKQGRCVAHRQGEWFVEGLARAGDPPQSLPAYRQRGVYVVIGGAGGIGEVWSRFMVEHYQAELVWIGRRPLDATIEEKLQALARLGPKPRYFSADATRLDSLQAACEEIRKVHPSLHGVVHSAIVLQDQSFSRMQEATFRDSLAAKVDVSVNMDAVFGGMDLDFMLFFSSLISFTKAPGQSNYAAGCTFKDSFAQSLARRRSYPIKIVNWGYWGNVGVVAAEFYNRRMQRLGLGSIEAREAMDALQTMVSSDVNQLVLVKAVDERAIDDMSRPEIVTHVPNGVTNVLSLLRHRIAAGEPPRALREGMLSLEVLGLAERILAATLQSCDRTPVSHPLLARWFDTSVAHLRRQEGPEYSAAAGLEELWASWDANEAAWLRNPNTKPHLALLKACLQALPDILAGTRRAADVMFPESSLHLVSGVYAGNIVSDYYNEVLGKTLCACISERRQTSPSGEIRILEIGAGTGGTTKAILPMLRQCGDSIAEYCYTDLSKAFLNHAQQHYRPQFPALRTMLFDASRSLASQAVVAGQYDFVVATNVLHATSDIRRTLRNAKALLKKHGVLLLNEMCGWSLFNHLTFGLLDGWWLYQDAELRLPGSPGLEPQTWCRVLQEEGFETVSLPARQAREFGQQIIVASSDGRIRQRIAEPPAAIKSATRNAAAAARPATSLPASVTADTSRAAPSLRDKAVSYLQAAVAKALRMDASQVEPGRQLAEYGLDSIVVVGVTSQLRRVFRGVSSTLFFDVRNIDGLADYLVGHNKEDLIKLLGGEVTENPAPPRESAPSRPSRLARAQAVAPVSNPSAAAAMCDVAIIGLAGRYPQAADLNEFWNNLASGRNCITEVPKQRWDWREYFDAERGKAGKTYTKWGGFLDRIDGFDPLFFKISPKEAKAMDPQERLFLQSCYHAIEDAGYTPGTLADIDKIGVFVGVMNSRYNSQPLHYSIANRVSYVLNFQGPSLAVDTACSASLTAIHLALESIYSGSSECAIAGGVNLIIDPAHYLELSALTMLSAGNQCKSFGSEADGFVDAEAVGAIVLKPLRQAQRDGDHIYGVIKGSAVNAGGKTNGYTVPNPQAQCAVIAKALQRANIPANDVSYVEAHGTGTALGDPIEIAGLTRAFEQSTAEKQFCAVGSLKSNIGHCESAAGIAGLTKVLLQLQHKQLVPSLHADVPNPEIEFERTPFRIQRTLQQWERPRREVAGGIREIARTAGVSSFGAGGSNAHIVVQEHEYPSAMNFTAASVIVPLSARTVNQLRSKARDLLGFMRSPTTQQPDLPAIAHTLQVGREAMDERLAFVVASPEELLAKLEAFVAVESCGEGTYRGQRRRTEGSSTAPQGVEAMLKSRALPALAELWTQGAHVDWSRLYEDGKPRRVSLPGYPFAQDRYWRERTDTEPAVAKPPAQTTLHPLLQESLADGDQHGYRAAFSGSEYFVADHPLAGDEPLRGFALPPVAYLEMARAAIAHSTGCKVMELFNVVWAEQVVLTPDRPITVAVFARDDDQLDYEIYSQHEEGDSVHFQGQSVLSAAAATDRLDIERLKARMLQGQRGAGSLYSSLAASGACYGPAYQSVTTIDLGEGELLAQIRLPKAAAQDARAGELIVHPIVVDCALQAAFDLMSPVQQPASPLALESLRIFDACADDMFAWVRYSQGDYTEHTNIQLDIDICDTGGNVCVQMRGVTYSPSRDASCAVSFTTDSSVQGNQP